MYDITNKPEVRVFRGEDKGMLDSWWEAHNLPLIPLSSLPATGYMVQGVAAGFLYLTNSDVAFIENYISNPKAIYVERQAALDAVTARLIECAMQNGYNYLVALTQSQAIYERALRFGFSNAGAYQTMNKDLRKVG